MAIILVSFAMVEVFNLISFDRDVAIAEEAAISSHDEKTTDYEQAKKEEADAEAMSNGAVLVIAGLSLAFITIIMSIVPTENIVFNSIESIFCSTAALLCGIAYRLGGESWQWPWWGIALWIIGVIIFTLPEKQLVLEEDSTGKRILKTDTFHIAQFAFVFCLPLTF